MNFDFGRKESQEATTKEKPTGPTVDELLKNSKTIELKQSIVVNNSNKPLEITFQGKHWTITQFHKSSSMKLLTSVDNLPKYVIDFVEQLKPNTLTVFDKEGELFIEINLSILRSVDTFHAFLVFYTGLLAKFPQLKSYTDLLENTELMIILSVGEKKLEKPMHVWLPYHFYVTVSVVDLIFEKVHEHFSPEDFSVEKGIDFLLSHGFDKDAIQTSFGMSRATFFNYQAKVKKSNDTKTEQQKSAAKCKSLSLRQEERTDLVISGAQN
jgi:hypothetical protein